MTVNADFDPQNSINRIDELSPGSAAEAVLMTSFSLLKFLLEIVLKHKFLVGLQKERKHKHRVRAKLKAAIAHPIRNAFPVYVLHKQGRKKI